MEFEVENLMLFYGILAVLLLAVSLFTHADAIRQRNEEKRQS